jgi:hypothetical protein
MRQSRLWPTGVDKHVGRVFIWEVCKYHTGFSDYDAANRLLKATDPKLVSLLTYRVIIKILYDRSTVPYSKHLQSDVFRNSEFFEFKMVVRCLYSMLLNIPSGVWGSSFSQCS